MFDSRRIKRLAREAAPGWADEAMELFGYNAEDVIRQQAEVHRYPERYSFEFCLKEIRKRRRLANPASPSLLARLLLKIRQRASASAGKAAEA